MIHRILEEQITSLLGKGKAIIIMGARQVGKSTLLETIFRHRESVLWMTGDDDINTSQSPFRQYQDSYHR